MRKYCKTGFKASFRRTLLSIKHRRWEGRDTSAIVSRDWDLVMMGTRLTKDFAAFLKKALR